MSMFCYLDASLLMVLLLCAIDVIRQTNPLRHPFHAIGFVAMAVGAAAWILQDMSGVVPSWYVVLFHGGLAIYSALGAYALWYSKRGEDSVTDNPGPIWRAIRSAIAPLSEAPRRQIRHPES